MLFSCKPEKNQRRQTTWILCKVNQEQSMGLTQRWLDSLLVGPRALSLCVNLRPRSSVSLFGCVPFRGQCCLEAEPLSLQPWGTSKFQLCPDYKLVCMIPRDSHLLLYFPAPWLTLTLNSLIEIIIKYFTNYCRNFLQFSSVYLGFLMQKKTTKKTPILLDDMK